MLKSVVNKVKQAQAEKEYVEAMVKYYYTFNKESLMMLTEGVDKSHANVIDESERIDDLETRTNILINETSSLNDEELEYNIRIEDRIWDNSPVASLIVTNIKIKNGIMDVEVEVKKQISMDVAEKVYGRL